MTSHQAAYPPVNTLLASPARIYDYYLGGKDNFAVDREAGDKALAVVPDGRLVARANRAFLKRAVTLMARHGIRQFIDIGTGLPTRPNVHEASRAVAPDVRVLYADNDPVVCSHNRARLSTDPRIATIQADVRQMDDLLGRPEVKSLIDFDRPVGVLLVAVLHFIADEHAPYVNVELLKDLMVSGSQLAISHITDEDTPAGVVGTIEAAYAEASAPAVFRSRDGIADFFDGLQLFSPGLVEVSTWRTDKRPTASDLPTLRILGGVGVKYSQTAVTQTATRRRNR